MQSPAMSQYDFVHLVLYAFSGSIQGRTKLQKIVYFVGLLCNRLPSLGYCAHYFGPYSGEVALAINKLRGLGFLQQTSAIADDVDYNLTPDGIQIAHEKAERYSDEWKRIANAAEHLISMPVNDYVSLSIAAKMFYIMGEEGLTTLDEAEQFMRSSSWKITLSQIRKAREFLESLGASHGAKFVINASLHIATHSKSHRVLDLTSRWNADS